ncbi:hypothetical protein AQUCO_01600310v1 [Aquilegia coerulea]|uniref:Dof zinc finger protein n=1 Tax=Aquilegia coerulea TaxID=218851 RepID=A0A2G5DR21_AQUCA|nr:hypothetical protein AQUCO_01600310v1 [Aquilegia coerulea]
MSKPVHFCYNCRRHWTVGCTISNHPGKGKIQQPETSMANQARMSQVALKCPRCESTNTNFFCLSKQLEPKPVHICKNCRRYWSAGGSLRTKQRLKDSGLQASVEGQVKTWQLEGSGEMASVGGSENNVVRKKVSEGIHTECSNSSSASADQHIPLSVWLKKFDSHIEKGSEGFPFDDEITPNEEVNLSNGSRSLESPESSNVVDNSSCMEKCNSCNDFYSNARGAEKAQHLSVDATATTPRQPSSEPSPLENDLPFIKSSLMWPQVESMDVFRSMPQQPHFNPLKEQDENLREGDAIGLMLSFTKLVEVTRKAQLDDCRSMFYTKLKALQVLEEHGFFVQPIRTKLVKLLRTKESCGQPNCQLTTVMRR